MGAEGQPPDAEQRRMAKVMVIVMWLLLLGILTLFFSDWLESEHNPNRHLANQAGDGMSPGQAPQVVLQRNRQGHYVATGRINGTPVVLLVDTGATTVSVPARLASELGLEKGARLAVQTAKGEAQVWATHLAEVCVGVLCLTDVRATINPHVGEQEVLLGMSVLRQLEFTQRGERLILRPMASADRRPVPAR